MAARELRDPDSAVNRAGMESARELFGVPPRCWPLLIVEGQSVGQARILSPSLSLWRWLSVEVGLLGYSMIRLTPIGVYIY
jgi:hypothetical protein